MKLRLIEQGEFLGIKCDFWIDSNDEIYMTRKQIGEALQYKTPEDAIYRIHERNKDRLDKLSVTVKLSSTDRKNYDTIVYKVKGIFDIIRYSRQSIADEFMDWVYDVIEAIRTGRISDKVLRDAGITVRRTMTDSVRDYYEESPNKKFIYKHLTDLAYKHIFSMNTKQIKEHLGLDKKANVRDHFTAEELDLVIQTERRIRSLVELGMNYEEIKNALSKKAVTRALPRKRVREAQEEAN